MQVDIAAEVSDEIQKNLASQQQAEVQAEVDNQRKVSFQSSMKVAASFEPNKFAQALQLERKSGVPARVAYDNWGQVEQIKQQDKLDGLFSTAPRTADALSNPSNAIVAKGDEDNLRNMELAVEKADFYQQGFFERQLAGPIRKWWDQDTLADTPGRLMQLDRLESAFDRVDAGEDIAGGFALDYRNADELGRKAMRDRISLQRNVALDKARVAQFDLEKAPVDPGDRAFQEAEGVTGALGAIADDPMWLGRVAAQSLPDMAQSLAAGLLNPILGGVTEGATAANYKFLEVLQEKGIDPGDPVQLLQALRNDDLLSEASTRSARYGAGIGAVSIASFGLLGRVLAPSSVGGKPITQGAREWINAGVQVPAQGGLGALGELTGQVAERGQLSDVDGKEVVLEGIVGALMAGPEAGVFAGKRFTNHMIQGRRAERAAGLQSDLVARSLESSTRKNDPASFDAIVGQQLAGQPNEFIEIPAAKLQELNQSGMVNIPELLENAGIDPNHFTAQVELGGTIRMKNSSYLAYLSDHDELLSSSIRVASNDYSLDDVQELDRQMVADMEKVVAQFGETDQVASAYSDVMGQLLAAGYERGAADTTARQYAAVMTRLAQQTGQTVEEVMTANLLNIAREIPQQVRRIKGDDLTLMLGRLRAGDIPQSADMFGKSLRDYLASAGGLDDTGGELAAFDADAGRVGRNRLARAGGQSLDDAAMAAWERGYFPGVAREDVTPNLLVDALREEAAGTPRYSVEQENATLRDQAANLDALQEFLDREGVDLASATDEEIRALLSGERQDDGKVLNQSALTPDQRRMVDMTEDEYIAAVNPENKRSDESDIVIVRAGDLDLPRGSTIVERSQDRSGQPVEVYADDGGSLYAVQGGEVVGQIENGDGETLNVVTVEAQGKGIGSTLAAALIRRDPFAQAGSFSPAGEATRRSAFRKVKAELQGDTQELNQAGDDDARGSITFGGRRDGVRRFDIRLGKKSDLSTVLHEMGHYYLEVIGDLVADGKANESLASDYGVILGWLGAEPGKMITVDQHEQFARGFEKYLAEGKAPSIELQGAFSRFKRWLTGIYRDLRALNVELSPEVRGVFDRLLASEDAITEAQEALALSEQYESSITALMTPAELANYRRASQQARDEATTEIEQEILRAEVRKDQEWYREQKRVVEREVRDELEASQPYQARKWLFGNAPYPGLGKPLRLDSAAVTELFGSKSKEARFLGRARVREGGVHPEIAASMLGYINPSEMLNDMRAVPGLAEAIKIETERRMAERYPDPRVDGTLAEKAMAAVGEREAEVQAIQLRALAREAGRKASQHRIIKEAARQHIARLKLRDVIPYTFQRASTKAAKAVEAALLDGNMPKAYEEKEKQLMNLHLYREAVKAQELAQKKRDQAKAYMKAGAKRKRLQSASVENYELAYPDGRVEYAATKAAANQAEAEGAVVTPLFNFLEQVDGLLTKYEFGTPRRAIRQQREALAAFLASMANESIVVNPPEWLLLDRAERTNWKELTIDELVDVVDMIRQIDQMAKNKLQVLKGDAWAEFEPLRDAIVATVELNASKARNSAFNKSFADEIRRWGREWLGTLPADQIARELDGQDELGPVQENITTPVQLAGRNALIREKAEHQGLADLIRQFYTDDQIKGMNDASRLIAIPEIGDSMTRMQMVMLMANMGNEGNRQALLSEARGIWTAETIQAVMGKLSSNDADFVEALWSWIDKFWPEVSENEARRTGVAPAKVQGTPYPVKLADGKIRVLKGGYFPLKYDGDLSIKTSQDEVANAFKNMTAGRTAKAYTPEGHKIERVGSGGRPVKLSFGVVTSHLNEVVRDIVMTDPVNQAWRFLHDRDVQSAFEKSNLKELFTALEIWMQDTAEGEVVDSSYTTAAARWLRTGFTANVMLFNLSNSALNLAGTHPLVVLGKRWALRGYRDAFAPANWNQMYELSTFMREARIDSFNKDLTLVQDQMAGKGGWRAAMTTAGFYLHNKLQMFMDAVTWMGAYQKGMSMDLVGADLVTYADQRVVEASGSGVFADRSSLERGTLSRQTRQNELVRGLTTLAGYMIRKMAIARRRTAETSFKDIGQAMNWAVDMALLFTVEGLMFALVKGNIPDDEDEDQAVEWTKTAAWETAASIGGGLPPFGRPIVAGIQGFGGGSSSIDIFAEQFGNAVTQAKQGDADVTALKSVVALVGTATKTPGIATNRVIDWLDRAGEGETPPWYELFTGNRDK